MNLEAVCAILLCSLRVLLTGHHHSGILRIDTLNRKALANQC